MPAEREFSYTERDFYRVRDLVREHTGIALSDAKKELVYSRLARRLRYLGLNCFDAYCSLLEHGNIEELTQFVNAITTNLTSFFREPHHFDFLAGKLLPTLINEKGLNRHLRIWSAGCSTGEEPYSIAIVVKETVPSNWDVTILATDIDSNVLATAMDGVYAEEKISGLSHERLRRWFYKGVKSNAGKLRVKRELREIVSFRQLNLMYGWATEGLFDIIFCRNVVIYFDKSTQRALFDRYADRLEANGYLFLGHSESLAQFSNRFEGMGKTIYRKRQL